MIFIDTTRTGSATHRSGLNRVTERLVAAWGASACPVRFERGRWLADGRPLLPGPADWLVTAELFSEEERPGFTASLASFEGRSAALFHDAIPLKRPDITWPKSVARHPDYMKRLAQFGRVFAVSDASRAELVGYWRWLGLRATPTVEALALGADLPGVPRVTTPKVNGQEPPLFLTVGIVEPRKNQSFLLRVAERLWAEGASFSLTVVGRVNPHFGPPIAAELEASRRRGRPVQHAAGLDDAGLQELYRRACIHLFPTQTEGCGLPLLEALWLGTPCFCSDLPVLRENAEGGGCVALPLHDEAAWASALRRALQEPAWLAELGRDACSRPLPTWAETAAQLQRCLTVA